MPPLGDPGTGPSNALREKHTEPEGHFARVPWTGLPLASQPRDLGEQGTEQCGWAHLEWGRHSQDPVMPASPPPQRHAHLLLDPFYG
ncbi:hypothetical protein PAL_GLEAN10007161 [Pteropus alecto]|uniref:Uncharacterized protein n=1 Tax=Pteropus alecto TaxID=9402 RepID=L5KB01_PTEAL|nr:hypothetical protein PAL_GLEAN10007161 [Pteropus alecto]